MYVLHIIYVRRRFALPCNVVTLGVQLTIYITNIYMPPIYIYTLFSIITYIWIDYYIYAPYIMYVRRRFALPCNVSDIRCSTYNIYITNIYICLQSIYTLFSIIIYIYMDPLLYVCFIYNVCT